jgi:hypothetical protein
MKIISSHESTAAEFKLKHNQLVEEADEEDKDSADVT